MEMSTVAIIAALIGVLGMTAAALIQTYGGKDRKYSEPPVTSGNVSVGDNSAAVLGNTGTIGDIKSHNTVYNNITINNSIQKSEEYKKLTENIKELQQDLKELSLSPERRKQKVQKLAELIEAEQRFEEEVYRLYETFTKIEIDTDRLKKAKEYFYKGEFTRADAILRAEELRKDQSGLLKAKELKSKEMTALDKDLENNANEYLIKAKLTALRYDLPDRFDQTCVFFKESIRSFKTAENLFEYALFLHNHNKFKDAEPLYKEALEIRRELAEKNPDAYLPYVAGTLNNLGNLQRSNSEFKGASESYKEALEIRRELAEKNPDAYLPDLAMTLNNLGNLQRSNSEFEGASESYKEALEIRRELAERNPDAYVPYVAMTLINLGIFYLKSIPDKEKSIKYAKEALEILGRFDANKVPYLKKYIETAKWILEMNEKSEPNL